jgi:hypothetical protein
LNDHIGGRVDKEIPGIEDNIEIESTGSSNKDKLATQEPEQRFSLRKRRNVSYNLKTKKFEFEGNSDSDYEDKPQIKTKR